MIVYHVAFTTSGDYLSRREPHRPAHIERLQGLRKAGIVIAGGPSPDGKSAELVYRLQQPGQLKLVIEEDPYWRAGAWTAFTPRSFTEFVEPWELPPVVLDGSRRVTIVEGPAADRDMAQFALIEMRGAGRIVLGGIFEDGTTLALATTADAETALGWFSESGCWAADRLTTRPFLHVL
ncbi:MAG: hypothetical protein HYU51_01060 [Candidatus Rokubacteria bacterium]|nr:hypothetical protein [Candidatus Rokubacteria bacterium]